MSRNFTLQSLQSRTLSELHVMRSEVQREIHAAAPGSAASREAWANLAAIDQSIRRRTAHLTPRF
jgi:hypothetical protein